MYELELTYICVLCKDYTLRKTIILIINQDHALICNNLLHHKEVIFSSSAISQNP